MEASVKSAVESVEFVGRRRERLGDLRLEEFRRGLGIDRDVVVEIEARELD